MIRPLCDRIIIQVPVVADTTKSGIFLATASRDKPQSGIVIAVGEGRLLDDGSRVAPSVKAEDFILFSQYAGTEIMLEGHQFLILSERDILAVLE